MAFVPVVVPHRRGGRGPTPLRLLFAGLVVFAVVLWNTYAPELAPAPTTTAPSAAATRAEDDLARLRQAFADGRGDLWVTLEGTVERTLRDDEDGSRHQRFVVRLADDLTLLVAHNIDLAPRVPLAVGDHLRLRGEYEWNPKGGLLHWTHHDPDGRPGGWIELDGRRYE